MRTRPAPAPYKRRFESGYSWETLHTFFNGARLFDECGLSPVRDPSDGSTSFLIEGPQYKRRAIDAFVRVYSSEL